MKTAMNKLKRFLAILTVLALFAGLMPVGVMQDLFGLVAQAVGPDDALTLENGYIVVTVSDKNGGFAIRTDKGSKVNKDDNNKQLLFQYDEDNTSFSSFRVTRNGKAEDYIFGQSYPGSSDVSVSMQDEALLAVWSVADITFTQTITLVKSGSSEHGTVLISYTAENKGAPADIQCRILMDTAVGFQDYAYYNIGNIGLFQEQEITLGEDGYDKAFYAVNDPLNPTITAYTINASINDMECKPYQTTFAHWNNLASTVFDYTADTEMTFTNPYNKRYMTADSAFALYFDLGTVSAGGSATVGTNYGVFSNETVEYDATAAVNIIAPDVLELTEDKTGYVDNGVFSVTTSIENIGSKDIEKIRIIVYASGGIDPLDQELQPTYSTYVDPYFNEALDFEAGENLMLTWHFKASPNSAGQYAKLQYKIYNVSDDVTMSTGAVMMENLMGEGSTYVLCPGSDNMIPAVKFTGASPEILFNEGNRNLYITGDNFSMLQDTSAYQVLLKRVDGNLIHGEKAVQIPVDNLQIDDVQNLITVLLDDTDPGKLPEGMYQLYFDYMDTAKEDLSGPALQFQVKNDIKYKNDGYGFLAVVKEGSPDPFYRIEFFASEEEYHEYLKLGYFTRRDVLLELRGSFTREDLDPNDGKVVYNGLSRDKNDNVMVINGALDVRNGTMTVTEEDGSVYVDFDADIYTTGAGTFVWSGVAALTELESGTDYGLITYDEEGNRTVFNQQTITLLWPSVGQGFQNILGMLFELKYGELGVIIHDENDASTDTRVVAFGASLDLSFLIPDASKKQPAPTATDSAWSEVLNMAVDYTPDNIRAVNRKVNYKTSTVDTDVVSNSGSGTGNGMQETGTSMGDDASGGDGDTKALSLQIDDILYGGELLGVNLSVALGIPGYVEGMPGMEAVLQLHTVGDWSIGVSGVCDFTMFYMEGSIAFKSKNGFPIPDELTFFMGGITPGINVDGFGVLWLQGAGGGIQNLYDTIFLTDTVPPLKLILEAQFSLMQVISARATLGLSLRGIDVTLSNGMIAGAIPVLNHATIQANWYPEFYFLGSVEMGILDAIKGYGYVIVDDTGFFEFFLRAAVQIPSAIPIVGGISLADANIGLNGEKVWGQVSALDIAVGFTYYWGDDFNWNHGDKVFPTYPHLAGMDDAVEEMAFPLAATDSGEVVYAVLGGNFLRSVSSNKVLKLYSGAGDTLENNFDLTKFKLTLNNNGNDRLVTLKWASDSEQAAALQAEQIVFESGVRNFYTLKLLDKSKNANDAANEGANANLTYDSETGMATLAVTFTKADAFGKEWTVTTPVASELVAYQVMPMPELADEIQAAVSGNEVTVTLQGQLLDSFDSISFIAEGGDLEDAVMVYHITENIASDSVVTFTLPESFSSGDYTLKLVAQDDNAMYYSESSANISYINPNQPSAPEAVRGSGAGNYMVDVSMIGTGDFDGYRISMYDSEGNPVPGVTDLLYYKDGTAVAYADDGTLNVSGGAQTVNPIRIGGQYIVPYTNEQTGETETMTIGLQAGSYTLEVRQWKSVANGKSILCSEAATAQVTVREKVNTPIILQCSTQSTPITVTRGDGSSYQQDRYGSGSIILALTSQTESFTGFWKLDGGTREGTTGQISGLTNSFAVSLEDLSDGSHTLEFVGKNKYGDPDSVLYSFSVDTQAPRLLVGAPVNGATYDYLTGKLNITGITDADATLTILDKTTGKTLATLDPTALAVDREGRFSVSVTLDAEVYAHDLVLSVKDAVGNATEEEVSVISNALGSIEELLLFSGSENVTNTKQHCGFDYDLALYAKLKGTDRLLLLNNATLVDWSVAVAEGEAAITTNINGAQLTTGLGAEGMVSARFLISDQGAYTVNMAFGVTSSTEKSLESEYTTVLLDPESGLFTGKEVTPGVSVWYKGQKLVEGTDFTVAYSNNVGVGTATVAITGIGSYTGMATATFEISYLPAEESFYTVSGERNEDGSFVGKAKIVPSEGYELSLEKLSGYSTDGITLTDEKKHEVRFYIRRTSDGAITDVITELIEIRRASGDSNTGDTVDLLPYILLMAVSAGAVVFLLTRKRK